MDNDTDYFRNLLDKISLRIKIIVFLKMKLELLRYKVLGLLDYRE